MNILIFFFLKEKNKRMNISRALNKHLKFKQMQIQPGIIQETCCVNTQTWSERERNIPKKTVGDLIVVFLYCLLKN